MFSDILQQLHRGRAEQREHTAPRNSSANRTQKGESNKAGTSTSRGKSRNKGDSQRDKQKSTTSAPKQDKKLDCGDLESRYGRLNLTSVNVVAHPCAVLPATPSAEPPDSPEHFSPMQVRACLRPDCPSVVPSQV